MIINKLYWVSSSKASKDELERLNKKMSDFYSGISSRQSYQVMIDNAHDGMADPTNILAAHVSDHIIRSNFKSVLEIGCGSGKILSILKGKGFKGSYTGIEMSLPVINDNKSRFPEAQWEVGSVYDKCNYNEQFDCCIAFFVLEHLIYPELALQKMLQSVKPGGGVILVFPDFSSSGIFPSQKVGWNALESTKNKLKGLKIADAVVSYLEGKILRKSLKEVNERFGSFVINTNPFCLSAECKTLIPDVDAVYLSNKNEIEVWAKSLGHTVSYPFGTDGMLDTQSLLVINKQMK
jgi:2-polyprenyl-3-methyl-5-hydroxy-6-metoxy-1,4-benzoquinol methylase